MTVYVWDWKNNCKLASNKISFHVRSISISPDGSYFVAVGNRWVKTVHVQSSKELSSHPYYRHVKFWYVNSSKMKSRGIVPLTGRSGLLGDQRNNNFLDVAFGKEDMVKQPSLSFLPLKKSISAGQYNFCDHKVRTPVSAKL